MAFSTQKDFLHIAFMNEKPKEDCPRQLGIHLKTYGSSTDKRSWSLSKDAQANFLTDTVACRLYKDNSAGGTQEVLNSPIESTGSLQHTNDSLIQTATHKLIDIEEVLEVNKKLKDDLELSAEKLKAINDENDKIKKILKKDTKSDLVRRFETKLQSLRQAGKISSGDEKELVELQKLYGKRGQVCEMLEAENASLRRITEKLSLRVKYDHISFEPVKNTDIAFLQNEVNKWRKETAILRRYEDKKLDQTINYEKIVKKSNRDVEKLNEIITERNKLREKLEMMVGIEDRIADLKQRALEAARLEAELKDLKKIINNSQGPQGDAPAVILASNNDLEACRAENEKLRAHIRCVERECAETVSKLRKCGDALKAQNCELQDKLNRICCFQEELCCVKSQLHRKDCTIRDYETQLYQLMDVIEELNGQCGPTIQNLQDANTQTKDGHLADLAWATEATLEQIKKDLEEYPRKLDPNMAIVSQFELSAIKSENNELKRSISEAREEIRRGLPLHATGECCSELEALKKDVVALKKAYDQEKYDLLAKIQERERLASQLSDDMKNKHDNLRRHSMTLEGSQRDMQSELRAKDNALQKSLDHLDSLEEEKQKLLKKNQEMINQIMDMENEMDKLKKEKDLLAATLTERNNEIANLLKKLKELEDQLDKARASNQELERKLKTSEDQFKECNKLIDEIKREQLKNQHLKTVVDAADDPERLKKLISDLERQLNEERQKLKQLMEENKVCKDDTQNLKKSLTESEAALKVAADTRDAALAAKTKVEVERDAAKEALAKAEAEIDVLKKSLESTESARLKLETALSRSEEALAKAIVERDAAKAALAKADAARAKAEADKDAAEAARAKADAARSRAESERDAAFAAKSACDAARAKAESECNETKNALLAAQNEIAQLKKLLADAEADRNKAKAALTKSLADLKALEAARAQADAARARAEAALAKAESERDAARSAMIKAQSEIDSAMAAKGSADAARAKAEFDLDRDVLLSPKRSKAVVKISVPSSPKKRSISPPKLEVKPHVATMKVPCKKRSRPELRTLCGFSPGRCPQQESSSTDLECDIKDLLANLVKRRTKKEDFGLDDICNKILHCGIASLSVKELIYLHGQVYKAGLTFRPEFLDDIVNRRLKCCKCRGFSCCLPSVPKDIEKKLISKTIFLENQLEEMNKCLQGLKTHYRGQANSSHLYRLEGGMDAKTEVERIFQQISNIEIPLRPSTTSISDILNRCRNEMMSDELPTRDRQ